MVLTPPQDKRPSQARRLTRAALLTAIAKSWVVLVYLPYLVLAGLITGTLTGLCAQLVVGRLSRN